jgi:hypothetical protein
MTPHDWVFTGYIAPKERCSRCGAYTEPKSDIIWKLVQDGRVPSLESVSADCDLEVVRRVIDE